MSLPSIDPTTTQAWKKLTRHFEEVRCLNVPDLFQEDPERAKKMGLQWQSVYVDISKNRITQETLSLLYELAEEVGLKDAIDAQFTGKQINKTEQRAVLHTALRDFETMNPMVSATLHQMKQFSQAVISGAWKGYTGKPITDIVNIGIGGSTLGPEMVTEALTFYKNHLNVQFLSNVDGDHIAEILKTVDRETTLFIVVSKSFTTHETLVNAHTVRRWFLEQAPPETIEKHFVAVSTNLEAVQAFGIAKENTFPLWDWVGGRFSVWSAVGLSVCCAIGYTHFKALLQGAHDMDKHFRNTDFEKNIPVTLALLSIWYNNFFGTETEAVIPYSQYLTKLVPYLQQAVMESNGKGVDRNGNPVTYQTGTIVWGTTGTNAQHAFFQLLHQGTKLIPVDLIVFSESLHGDTEHQNILMANCLAQSEALMQGTLGSEVENSFKRFEGNKPNTTLLLEKLTPNSLGRLMALYEHKLFVQGVIWNIFSYDQWGVELGKKLANNTLKAIRQEKDTVIDNPSTQQLLKKLQNR
ncbi:glucose-6-phosphate isomerase [Altibacter sp.]|uniref:glucose-6-phosphate isomerase n=1 Tax=Altibacter sp. TaxID=2024823 RepID=UPI000C9285D2|nr:glucose-6-phosphate isomerase [Altibacter sp.]MAP54621.1 glucose-6-phosphate isomerase [Altibacter sp.]